MTPNSAPPPQTVSRVGGAFSVLRVGVKKHIGAKLGIKNDRRVQDTLRASSTRFPSLHRFIRSHNRFRKSGYDRQGNLFHVGEGRDRGSSSLSRILLSPLPRPQADRLETDHQLEEAECDIPRDAAFPHEYDKRRRQSPSP